MLTKKRKRTDLNQSRKRLLVGNQLIVIGSNPVMIRLLSTRYFFSACERQARQKRKKIRLPRACLLDIGNRERAGSLMITKH